MKIQAIVPCAGVGVRLKQPIPKPLVPLLEKPIFLWTLDILDQCSLLSSVILVVHANHQNDFQRAVEKHAFKKDIQVIAGGEERCDSVYNGLKGLDDDTDLVLIHDGVRPLITVSLLEDLIRLGQRESAAIVAVPVKPTIKRVDQQHMRVEETLDRNVLWEVQTPQIFKKDILLKAYRTIEDRHFSDDAALLEHMGESIKVMMGSYENIKITTKEDLVFAEALLRKERN